MRTILCILFIAISIPLIAQLNNSYPDLFNTYFYSPGLINPAYVPAEGKITASILYRHRTGIFKKIASYGLVADRTFRRKNESAHLARMIFTNEKQGPYIARTRGYFNYAYSLGLAENTYLSAGLAIGFNQLAFTAPSATSVGSYKSPDVSLGLMLRKNHAQFGVSMMQALNNLSEPLTAPIRLRRYYNFFLAESKDLSAFWSVKANLLWEYFPSTRDNLNGNLFLSYNEIISFGSGLGTRTGLSFFLSVQTPIEKDVLKITMAYNSTFSILPANAFEVNLLYILK